MKTNYDAIHIAKLTATYTVYSSLHDDLLNTTSFFKSALGFYKRYHI